MHGDKGSSQRHFSIDYSMNGGVVIDAIDFVDFVNFFYYVSNL